MPDTPYWITNDTRTFMSRGYLQEGVSIEQRIRQIAETAEKYLNIEGYADKFEDYMNKGYFGLSTPVWCNYGLPEKVGISCFSSYISDNITSILNKATEIGQMSKHGGGTSAYFGELRPRGAPITGGGKSDGPYSFLEIYQAVVNSISQGQSRRGNCAVYLPVEHPDIKEWLHIQDEDNPIQKLSFGVTITDAWMESMLDGDKDKQKIWSLIIKRKYESGYPYIFWTDTVNNKKRQWYKDLNYKIYNANLCSEAILPTSPTESFVCCLSSMNLLKYDEWKYTDAVKILTYFLDTVISNFIENGRNINGLETAVRFAERHRAVGIGVLGWHSLLQSKMIAFESIEAKKLNVEIFKHIKDNSDEASKEMAIIFGEPDVLKGYGYRNSTLQAVAPTTSNAFILGQVSQSIEPENSNYYVKDNAKGRFTYKNPYLKKLLKEKSKDTKEIWDGILNAGGSVAHLDFLSDHEKKVFATFGEIPQIEIITQAAMRQDYIDQGQSLNLMIHPKAPAKDTSKLMIEAWKLGIKTLYYNRSTSPTLDFSRSLMNCVSCES